MIIDPHYELRHRGSMSDALIVEMVLGLDQGIFVPNHVDDAGYQYFTIDTWLRDKTYRLVWLFPPNKEYLGVVNAYRRRHGRIG